MNTSTYLTSLAARSISMLHIRVTIYLFVFILSNLFHTTVKTTQKYTSTPNLASHTINTMFIMLFLHNFINCIEQMGNLDYSETSKIYVN